MLQTQTIYCPKKSPTSSQSKVRVPAASPNLGCSIAVAFLSILLAVPSSVSFVYTNEFLLPRKITFLNNLGIDTFSGIPSVIFGLWGLVKVVPYFAVNHPPGTSLLVGAIILAMMIFPGLVVGIRGLIQTFNQHYQFSSACLNLSSYSYFFHHYFLSISKIYKHLFYLRFLLFLSFRLLKNYDLCRKRRVIALA